MQKDNGIWLNKFISESGICSRREADKYIEQGNVFVNGKRAQRGDQVFTGDVVKVNGMELEPREAEDLVFIALNKPVGIESTTEKNTPNNIVDFVNHPTRIFPIGRLDKDSQGLIFLTNNGDLVNKILRAGNNHEKEYVVTVNKPFNDDFIESMAAGVPILGVTTKKCKVKAETAKVFRIILKQGMNRQIRRMCEHFGYEVTKLERVRIMNITVSGIAQGHWRDLTEDEMKEIYRLTKDSASESKKQATAAPPKKQSAAPAKKNTSSDAKPFADRSGKRTSGGAKPKNAGGGGGRSHSKPKSASGGGRRSKGGGGRGR
jgi:23S rRNA pseudouridine2604 synthase